MGSASTQLMLDTGTVCGLLAIARVGLADRGAGGIVDHDMIVARHASLMDDEAGRIASCVPLHAGLNVNRYAAFFGLRYRLSHRISP